MQIRKSALFVYLNIRLKIRLTSSDYRFCCLSKNGHLVKVFLVFLKTNPFLNFLINQEMRIGTMFKNLIDYSSIWKEICKSIKSVGVESGTMYGLCKVQEQEVDDCPPFRPILLIF